MPRQSYLVTDFFITASEEAAKDAIASLPRRLPHITLLKENGLLKTMRFLYEHPDKSVRNYVDVSILPMDVLNMRFILHGSNTNGQSFHTDQYISRALHHFEQLLQAALIKEPSGLHRENKAKPFSKRSFSFLSLLFPGYQ